MKQDWEIYRDTGILGAYRPEQVILRQGRHGVDQLAETRDGEFRDG